MKSTFDELKKAHDQAKQQHMPDGVIVLKNGCMCCSGETPGSELERVLDKLLEMGKLDGGTLPFDHVLIETTGLADPSPIVQVLCRREMERSVFYLDGVLALVDAQNILRHLQPSGPFGFARRRTEAEKQLALADKVIVNKMDLLAKGEVGSAGIAVAFAGAADPGGGGGAATGAWTAAAGGAISSSTGDGDDGDDGHPSPAADALAQVTSAVRAVNASAALVLACRADVPLRDILNLRAFSSAGWLHHHDHHLQLAAKAEAIAPTSLRHAASVSCVSLTLAPPIDLERLQAWLQRTVSRAHDDLYRIKGVLCIAGHDERFVLHGVHANVHGAFERPWGAEEVRISSMVLIGLGLDQHELEAGFRATAAAEATPEVSELGGDAQLLWDVCEQVELRHRPTHQAQADHTAT